MIGSVTKWATFSLVLILPLRTFEFCWWSFPVPVFVGSHFLLLWPLIFYKKSLFALSLLKIIVFFLNQFYQRETLLSFNKLCKNAYGCLLIIRGTFLAICMMTLETSIPLIWVLCVPWSKASMFCPRCDVRSEIFLLLLDRVTYWDQSYNEILTEQKYAYMMKLPL